MAVAVILGSAFSEPKLSEIVLEPVSIDTPFGAVTLYRYPERQDAWVLFRHGVPHRYLPHQIPFRAHTAALKSVGCGALLVTSSVGVMDADVPLFEPLLVDDLLMPENRLPDGSACSMFTVPTPGQGHLVLDEGLFNKALGQQASVIGQRIGWQPRRKVVFAYVPGPRTKTSAENIWWRRNGAVVNSMSLGPEVVLANELEIPTVAVVVGHKYSTPKASQALDRDALAATLDLSRTAMQTYAAAWLDDAEPARFANTIYRF